MITYTWSERNEKNYTVGQAVKAAQARLPEGKQYCSNALKGRPLTDSITLVELNELADQIVDDTNYYG